MRPAGMGARQACLLASSVLQALPCTPRYAPPPRESHQPPHRLTLVVEKCVLHHWAGLLLWKVEWSGGPVLGPLPSPPITGVKGASAGSQSPRCRRPTVPSCSLSKLFRLTNPKPLASLYSRLASWGPGRGLSYLPRHSGFWSSCGEADSEGWDH